MSQKRFHAVEKGLIKKGFKLCGLEPDTRYKLTQALGEIMSECSEELFSAGWLIDFENLLPEMVEGEHLGESLSVENNAIKALFGILGHWAKWEYNERTHQTYYIPHIHEPHITAGKNSADYYIEGV